MLAGAGLAARMAWTFPLYGGTVLIAAQHSADGAATPDESVRSLVRAETSTGVRDPVVVAGLARDAHVRARALRQWLLSERAAGHSVLGYGAASRAVALLRSAGVDSSLLPGVVDASAAKHGLRMPGTDIPVVGPAELVSRRPSAVLLFVADLRAEVSQAYPEVVAAGGRWVDADSLGG
jgi:hypothetical protein